MIQVYKFFERTDVGLKSVINHPYAMDYPEDGTLVKPKLEGSLLFGHEEMPKNSPPSWLELWLCETTGPISHHAYLEVVKLEDPEVVKDFWANMSNFWIDNSFAMFPDVRLIRRVQ